MRPAPARRSPSATVSVPWVHVESTFPHGVEGGDAAAVPTSELEVAAVRKRQRTIAALRTLSLTEVVVVLLDRLTVVVGVGRDVPLAFDASALESDKEVVVGPTVAEGTGVVCSATLVDGVVGAGGAVVVPESITVGAAVPELVVGEAT